MENKSVRCLTCLIDIYSNNSNNYSTLSRKIAKNQTSSFYVICFLYKKRSKVKIIGQM